MDVNIIKFGKSLKNIYFFQTPSPQRRKDPPQRENKLRLFLKRSSEPLLNLQNASQQVNKSLLLNFIVFWCVTNTGKFILGMRREFFHSNTICILLQI